MNNLEAINHLLEVKARAEKNIDFAKKAQYAINIKQSYDDILAVDLAVFALSKGPESFSVCARCRIELGPVYCPECYKETHMIKEE